jgi:Hint domain
MSNADYGYMYLVERDATGNFLLPPEGNATDATFSFGSPDVPPGQPITLSFSGAPQLDGTYDYIGEVSVPNVNSPGYIVYSLSAGQYYLLTNTQIQGNQTVSLGMVQSAASDDMMACFFAGTRILVPSGEVSVESLKIGDIVLTHDRRPVSIRWVGRQTISRMFADDLRVLPIRIKAGSLMDCVPSRDLLVSPDHALLVDGVLIHAAALVNGTSIVREANVPSTFTYYHVETGDHSLILAENTPAETFIDNVDRMAFDNWQEYQTLYPESKPIVEMPHPRAKAHRQVPRAIREHLDRRGAALYTNEISTAA